jgi:hypothetical protein
MEWGSKGVVEYWYALSVKQEHVWSPVPPVVAMSNITPSLPHSITPRLVSVAGS